MNIKPDRFSSATVSLSSKIPLSELLETQLFEPTGIEPDEYKKE